ncbi:cellulose biosynthesis cyclic di-GMP-binding regulatory protein BcsB [Marinobacterium marinum]|nr:cellulose biosynthesis cyclic di-GMP-binding regulatory protein BcsB [Marinobacterium marinum]
MRIIKHSLVASLALLFAGTLHAVDESIEAVGQTAAVGSEQQIEAVVEMPAEALVEIEQPPGWPRAQSFALLGDDRDRMLLGVRNTEEVNFALRRDRIAKEAGLNLNYTPSPSLLPGLSHLRVYLNDVLMDTVVIAEENLGRSTQQHVALDPKLVTDFNQVRIEFVGHYADVCEDPGHSSLWLSLGKKSRVELYEQALDMRNDLAFFPQPFFDEGDRDRVRVNLVLPTDFNTDNLQSAAVLASYFGSLSGWRGAEFPVLFEHLPVRGEGEKPIHSLVLATNQRRPAFMSDPEVFPPVSGADVQLIDHPEDRYSKVLLIQGQDDAELAMAVRALALGGKLLRGERAEIRDVQPLLPRQPYDAPNWMPTDRPVRFAELVQYPGQLQTRGLIPDPIELEINLPPDLFVWRNQGIPVQTRYRYTAPTANDESRLNISINGEFIMGLPLTGGQHNNLEQLRLAVTSEETASSRDQMLVPALKIGARNTLRYDFSFATTFGSAQPDHCQTTLMVDSRALIDGESTIDFTGYHHFIAMPDLSAFARSGFPFSRMADLSETRVLMPENPSGTQISLMLETLAGISAQTGYPAFQVSVGHDVQDVQQQNVDWLVFGSLPEGVEQAAEINALLQQTSDWLLQPPVRKAVLEQAPARLEQANFPAENRVEVSAQGPLAAIIGTQSPLAKQRSIVALLASDEEGYRLLRETLSDSGALGAVQGSVSLIRTSGVDSHLVGEQYYVGHLPWWLKLWYLLSAHPLLLAALAALCTLLVAILLWKALRWAAHRRVQEH